MKLYKVENDVYVLKFIFWKLLLISVFFLTCHSIIFIKTLSMESNIVESNEIFWPLIGLLFVFFSSICSLETGYYRFDLLKKTLSWKTIRFMRKKHGEINLEKGTKVKLKSGFGSRRNHFKLILVNEQQGLNMSLHNIVKPQSNKLLKSIADELNKLLDGL